MSFRSDPSFVIAGALSSRYVALQRIKIKLEIGSILILPLRTEFDEYGDEREQEVLSSL
jgi:hypothetical protein